MALSYSCHPGAAQLPLPLPRARDEACCSQRRARAFPAGIGLATAARREPGLPGPPRRPVPPCALRRPWPAPPPPCPGWPAQLAPCGAGRNSRQRAAGPREGRALAGGYMAKSRPIMPPLRCLAQPERAEPLSGLARPSPEKRAAGAAGVSSERSHCLARPRASSGDRRASGGKWPLNKSDLLIIKKTLFHLEVGLSLPFTWRCGSAVATVE
jgi:hypothetical protein